MFKIKEMREAASMTQQEAADALGISRTRYSNWENEYREINLADACRLAVLFNCTLEELVEGRKQKSSVILLSIPSSWYNANCAANVRQIASIIKKLSRIIPDYRIATQKKRGAPEGTPRA